MPKGSYSNVILAKKCKKICRQTGCDAVKIEVIKNFDIIKELKRNKIL